MRRLAIVPLVWLWLFTGEGTSARRDDTLRQPAVQDVLMMMKGGVAYDVMIERIRRMEDLPTLDADVLAFLGREEVPDRVLLEMIHRSQAIEPCRIPQRPREQHDVLDAPAIRQVLRDLDDGMTTERLVERVGHLDGVPVLDARAINKLTSKGVPDPVLLELVRKQEIPKGCDPVRAEPMVVSAIAVQPTPAGDRKQAAVEPPTGAGRIRVIVKSSLPVSYLEVQVDGDSVAHKGSVEEGETKPGWTLPPPAVLDLKRGEIVYESESPAGFHDVTTAVAVSTIVETDWDDTLEAYGQRYETTRVGPLDADGATAVCDVREGQLCVVLARLVERGRYYAIEYESATRSPR